jgi:proteasome regulatory subunit
LVAGRYRLPALTASTRLSALLASFRREQLQLSFDLEQRLPFVAASAVWARGSVFRRLARRARMISTNDGGVVGVATVESALASIGKASSAGSEVRFLAQDDAGSDFFSTVGGNEKAKMALEDALALDSGRQRMLDAFGLLAPTGILLYGPPGTGKTLLAKAVAKLLRSRNTSGSSIGGAFVSLSSSDIVRAEIGSGEKMVVLAFETARMNAPSVVFIDEFQALFTERSSGGSGRLSTTLLQCMDDVKRWRLADKSVSTSEGDEANKDSHVVVLAATNTPWMVDKAFLRPGRFDRVVNVGLPSVQDRVSILRLLIGRMKMREAEDMDDLERTCVNLAECTQGFSGADLAALCRAAAVRCLLENGECVDERHFIEVQERGLVASSSGELVERIRRWNP